MGRPSRLEVEVEKRGGRVTDVAVGGTTVIVSEGPHGGARPVIAARPSRSWLVRHRRCRSLTLLP